MSFSKGQQPEYRALVFAAWAAHCRREGIKVTTKPDRDWYERELYLATGHTSGKDCNAGRDYDLAMGHFEGMAGVGIKWQMKVYSGDVKRMMHELGAEFGPGDLVAAGVDEQYLLAAIRRGFNGRSPWQVSREELIVILGEVKRHVRRLLQRENAESLAGGDPDWTV